MSKVRCINSWHFNHTIEEMEKTTFSLYRNIVLHKKKLKL